MIDLKIVRQNPELVKDSIKKRCLKIDLDAFLELDKVVIKLKQEVEELKSIRNKVSKEIPTLPNDEKQAKISEMKEVNDKIKSLDEELLVKQNEFDNTYYKLPNFLDETTAIWETDEDNVTIETFLEPTKFDFTPKAHYEIWAEKWWIDAEKASKVSGSRFWYLKWDLALLNMAIVNFAISKLTSKWFEMIIPPVLVKERAMFGTGFLTDSEDWFYKVNPEDDNLHLVWTSEVPVVSYHSDEILDLEKPKMYVAYSPCFRKEAWSAWKDMRWILRWHQFEKVEMLSFCKKEDAWELHNFMVSCEEEIWQDLKIPYRKQNVCSWDLWNPALKKIDLEAYMPGQDKYREVTSCSNVWEFQSRRLSIKYKNENWENVFATTLNGTVVALSRCLISVIENYQTKDGDVIIPEVLKPFMWGKEII